MRTKVCVLGAVLGAAAVLPVMCGPSAPELKQEKGEQTRGGAARQAGRPLGARGVEAFTPVEPVPAGPVSSEPKHPCELVTVMKVPCDPAVGVCEYTYWQCPRHVKPLRA